MWPVFEILDSVSAMATGRKSQLNIVERRNIEMIKNVEAKVVLFTGVQNGCRRSRVYIRHCIAGHAYAGSRPRYHHHHHHNHNHNQNQNQNHNHNHQSPPSATMQYELRSMSLAAHTRNISLQQGRVRRCVTCET